MSQPWIGSGTWDDQIGPQGQSCPHFSVESPEFTDDFHNLMDRLRAECPVAWDEGWRRWFVTSGDVLYDVARDWQTYSSAYGVGGPQYPQLLPMDADDPQHRDWRRPLNPHFSAVALADKRSAIRSIADELLDDLIDAGRAEFLTQLCRPLPGRVFFSLVVDLPEEDLDHLQDLVEVTVDPTDRTAQQAASAGLNDYVRKLVEERRSRPPTDDLVGRVVFAEIDGCPASSEDAVSILTMLILGGLETTTNTLAGALAHLGADAALQRRLREDPTAMPPAVEEFLRLYSPTSFLTRYVTKDTDLRGLSIRQGQRVALSFAAANRDPDVFTSPHELRLDRPQRRHYAFGVGPHLCLGSHLARLMMHETLSAVLDRLSNIRWAPGFEPRYRYANVRALHRVDLTFERAAGHQR